MKDKSKLTAIILVIVTILVVIITFVIDKSKDQSQYGEIQIVRNYSEFYTVDSCLYRTITYLSSKDTDSLYLLLDDKYKEENKIKKQEVIDLFGNVEESSTFASKKMYYQILNENITKYYVYGLVSENQIFDEFEVTNQDYTEMYFVLYMDSDNKTFSIEPYTKDLFNELGGDDDER